MNFFCEAFSQQSIQSLADAISAFLAANPTFVPVSVSNVVEGAGFYAILVYHD